MHEDSALAGRVAMVTGGSRGIGRAIVEALARQGAAVGIAFRDREEPAREVEAAIRARGGRALAARCDVASEAAVASFVELVTTSLGPIDILVNNAGITRESHTLFFDERKWDEI